MGSPSHVIKYGIRPARTAPAGCKTYPKYCYPLIKSRMECAINTFYRYGFEYK